ncbi:glycolipid 2-alpha-mannosyltransferase [Colletotrichum incanum]|uniref:Glycolipid 2-alpha-mannosyltransferase n=1 Tax=Colletotrichum incanum TaxID=1573173 RepID=A0A167DVG9_COLIC|nr:glycolipid 2-alpha-mannosyltransferase [Colletotrichum incanum]OHW93672.1 glycolipid 2-alpha-mannosyltransferase [Colletotrichum incanum]
MTVNKMLIQSKLFLPWRCRFILMILLIILHIPSAFSGPLYVRDSSPRAAFVALVAEHQLDQMVNSVAQLEQRFNSKYCYDWVFFSFEELSEDFKDATSNATAGTVTYNLIAQQDWPISRSLDPGRFEAGLRVDADVAKIRAAHHKCRWSAGLFAQEKRLQAYDWFWMVEPGAQFMCDINVDVFRIMEAGGIAYGVSEISFQADDNSKLLLQNTKSFMAKHPDLVRTTAGITWILSDGSKLSKPGVSSDYYVYDKDEIQIDQDFDLHTRACRVSEPETETGIHLVVSHEANTEQYDPNLVAHAYTTQLEYTYDQCNTGTPIEIGNLNYFRGPHHTSYFKYLENSGDFCYDNTGDVNVHSLSVSMFLPRDKFWLLGDMICEIHEPRSCPPLPLPTSNFDSVGDSTYLADVFGSSWFQPYEGSHLSIVHRIWANMASGIARQNCFPAAQTGHTALDERNFKIYKPERYPVDVKLGWYSLEDTWRSWSIDRAKWFLAVLGW